MSQILMEKLPNISAGELANLQQEVRARETLLQQRIAVFEKQYQCSLLELEQKLEAQEIAEHPAWEDSIEWRNALEQLEQIKLSSSIFAWLQNLLTQSAAS
ncbi:MAG: hypothetical protein KDJ97_38470 [Anaerolineae bacterium]|nr:hypothetical protein [Anaerolineae bacterium]MCB9103600.1 hypothetical protein [Anaerolineales bacterium]